MKSFLLVANWIGLVFFVLAFAYAGGEPVTLVTSALLVAVFVLNIRYITKKG